MEKFLPGTLPKPHQEFLHRVVAKLAQAPWLIGIAATGSFATDTMDEFSDLDLVLAIGDDEHAAVMENRLSIAASLGPLLSAFTGEHVGQPRLLICLYGPPLLHVDLIFDTLADAVKRAGDLIVLWEREERLSTALTHKSVTAADIPPGPDSQWVEDHFWVWVHKACSKIGRGELFEAIEYLAFLRSRVLGPLGLRAAGQRPIGMRGVEFTVPALAQDLQATLAHHDAQECLAALHACVELYRRLRGPEGAGIQYRHEAEIAVTRYMAEQENRTY